MTADRYPCCGHCEHEDPGYPYTHPVPCPVRRCPGAQPEGDNL